MSIECLNAALKVEGLTPTKKFILVILGNYCDERGTCYPSYRHIAEMVGLKDTKGVQKAIKEFEQLGLISIEHRKNDLGGHTSNRYHFSKAMGGKTDRGLRAVRLSVPQPSNTKDDTKDIINIEFERFWKIYPRKISKFSARIKYEQIVKTYDKEKLYHQLEKFVAHCLAEEIQQTFICHCTTFLNQRRYLDYEDIKLEDIKKVTKTTKDKPKWMQDKEILSKQNEVRVSSSWSTENKPKNSPKVNPKASQKLAEIASKHNIKGRSR
jgi:hypothetical protein